MPTPEAQAQSFSLANIVPQAPRLNRGIWERIEAAVRRRAERAGELYVVTGLVFEGANIEALDGRVLVPTATFKAVYDPAMNAAGAYVCTNRDEPQRRVVSVAELAARTGIDPFPTKPNDVKAAVAHLPIPRARRGRPRSGDDNDATPGQDPFAGAY